MSEEYIKKLEKDNKKLEIALEKFKDILYFNLRENIRYERCTGNWSNPDLEYGHFLTAIEENFEAMRIKSDNNIREYSKATHRGLDQTEDGLIFEFINKLENDIE